MIARDIPSQRYKPWLLRVAHSPESWMRFLLVVVFLLVCLLVFFGVERPIENGDLTLRLGADTQTYYDFAKLVRENPGNSGITFLSFNNNLIGPVALALALQSPLLIVVFNIAAFLLAIEFLRPTGVSRTWLALLLAINATTLVSLVTLNKEIFALVATLMLCRYVSVPRPSKWLLWSMLLIGLMARWQQPALTLLFLYFRRYRPFRQRPLLAVGSVVLLITVSYPLIANLPFVRDFATYTADSQKGSIALANTLQTRGLFPIALLLKAVQSLAGRTFSITYWMGEYWTEDFTDLAGQVVIHLHTLAMVVLLVVAFVVGRIRMNRPLILFSVVYLVVTSANLFIQPRYQYPLYIILAFELARREDTPSPLMASLRPWQWFTRPLFGAIRV